MTTMKIVGMGLVDKMRAEWGEPIQYFLRLGEEEVAANPLITRRIRLRHTGRITCCHCGRATKKSFSQGYCFPCFKKLAQCDSCIVSPEKCHYAAGTCREPSWGMAHCMVPHIVYLANSSGVKVGITRKTQLPTRWIDQGAIQALPIYEVSTRHLSGLIEVIYGNLIPDKTNWRTMLKGNPEPIDLVALRARLHGQLLPEIEKQLASEAFASAHYLAESERASDLPGKGSVVDICYPVSQWPLKVGSFNLDKDPECEGILMGIKGQYLILDTGCINIRKYGSYELELAVES